MLRPVDRLATNWTVPGSNPVGVSFIRTNPDQPWDPLGLLLNGQRDIPGGNAVAPRLKKQYSYNLPLLPLCAFVDVIR